MSVPKVLLISDCRLADCPAATASLLIKFSCPMALRCHNAFANRYASLDLSLCVSGAVLTYDSRHPTRTQYPGDVSTCRCYVDLGTSRRLQVALSSNQGSALYGTLYLRLEFKGKLET